MIGADYNIIRRIGSHPNIIRILRRFALESINSKPCFSQNFCLSLNMCETYSKNKFYQYGTDNYRNIDNQDGLLLFNSDELGTTLINNKICCVDGTFTVVPDPYYQLYTIDF